ncbi:peptide chain release factor 1 [Caldisericum exile]|uniref:Peptide chain release factor 1 n=1 Tax=Caldisericum exile (strain DSM 21853 / NBRC 104410 / AZM16c01) TaxID=511051 RepID=A0A7U6GEL9_CALEA|nr:peptide chain release factor 1 [Caldisericum exile]BAL80985.1 peptide chain release factor 1 [Caldisericum exile AZM16c01]
MIDRLEKTVERYNELSRLLSDSSVISNPELFKKYSIEYKELEPIVNLYIKYKKVELEIKGVQELLETEDPELQELSQTELEHLEEEKERILNEIKILLIPKDPYEGKNIIMEIRAGVGGEEAALFAKDLYKMYLGYADKMGWRVEILDSHETDLGGFKEVIFSVSGKDVYKHLKYESGVHRVQRVPETEASGRIHTSTATVAVLPEAEEVDVQINPDDLRIDIFHASGHGGQNVQKVATAIRIIHKPTGIMVTCQDERSQLQNKIKAMRILRARLLDLYEQQKEQEITSTRRAQIGRGNRNERIRTYNFPQGRVTDHRINLSLYNLPEIMEGNLDELVNALMENERAQLLEEYFGKS